MIESLDSLKRRAARAREKKLTGVAVHPDDLDELILSMEALISLGYKSPHGVPDDESFTHTGYLNG